MFGAFLLFTGVKMARHRGKEVHPERNPVLRGLRRFVPMTTEYQGVILATAVAASLRVTRPTKEVPADAVPR
ncbi:MAG: hypothetical protein ACRD12_08425 [Acidimicrobiales bacterium]